MAMALHIGQSSAGMIKDYNVFVYTAAAGWQLVATGQWGSGYEDKTATWAARSASKVRLETLSSHVDTDTSCLAELHVVGSYTSCEAAGARARYTVTRVPVCVALPGLLRTCLRVSQSACTGRNGQWTAVHC
jgi:hypothetical protein